ncbi:hypothetical protein U1872_11305 [Sphingomonas sp. RB3P16]|uniref:hypothetical protein n=1 Tax=Parasphingomonas frigoris TaxID=3096163 RepID=UPI002FC8975C
MPRGYRYIILAALGWLTLTGASEHKGNQRNQGHGESQHKQGVAPSLPVKPADNPGDPKGTNSKCKDDRGNEADCTVVATNAALDQARAADWQAWAAVGGVGIGLATMIAAIFAALFAKKAADETWRGANAAENTLAHAQDTAQRQLRAYIYAVSADAKHWRTAKTFTVECGVTVENSGTTPAEIITENITTQIFVNGQPKSRSGVFRPDSNRLIGPNSSYPMKSQVSIDVEDFTVREPLRISVIIYITYKDYTGALWKYHGLWWCSAFNPVSLAQASILDLAPRMQFGEAVSAEQLAFVRENAAYLQGED